MPSPSSKADVQVDAENLLAAIEANAAQLADVEAVKAPLVQSLAEYKSLTVRRDTFNADKQVLSKDIIRVLRQIREQSTEVRAVIRAKLGTRSEKLVEFRVAPRRPGKRRKRGTTPVPEPVPEAKGPAALSGGG